jgi:hypothetical protein
MMVLGARQIKSDDSHVKTCNESTIKGTRDSPKQKIKREKHSEIQDGS